MKLRFAKKTKPNHLSRKLFLSLTVGLLLWGPQNSSASPLRLKTASQDNSASKFAPQNTEKPGICVEIMKALQKVDPDISFTGIDELVPLARIESEMVANKIEIFFGLIKNAERAAKYNFIDVPLFEVRQKVAVRADDNIDVKTFADIKKLGDDGIVLTTQGTAYVTLLEKEGLKIDAGTKNNGDLLKKLIGNRGRFFYQAELNLKEYIAQEKVEDKVKILPAIFKEDGQYAAVSKSVPAEAVEKIRSALLKLEKSGDLKKIYEKYVN